MTVVRERGNGNERHHSGGKDRLGQRPRRFSPRPPLNTGISSEAACRRKGSGFAVRDEGAVDPRRNVTVCLGGEHIPVPTLIGERLVFVRLLCQA
jgi:hypothetical protein